MAQPAPKKSPVGTPDATVTVHNGQANSSSVTIPSNGTVEFQTTDTTNYLIESWTKDNGKHPSMCVVLPASGSVTLQGNPDASDHNARCPYNIKTPGMAGRTAVGDGGADVIIIGSGAEGKKS